MEGDDDYLSDKFLSAPPPTSSQPKSYSQLRKEAQQQAKLKNEQNKTKSRRQRELENREEGLSKSLFDKAKEEEDAGISTGNKALSMMMKMGFKPGQALGKLHEPSASSSTSEAAGTTAVDLEEESPLPKQSDQKIEPLPINEWAGKKGIGLGKRPRPPSPTSAERVAKMTKMAEAAGQTNFRDRARQEYEERRAEGKLHAAQRTCFTLDEINGKKFNVLWLNPRNPNTFPDGLLDALALHGVPSVQAIMHDDERSTGSVQKRLKLQMQADALHPISLEDDLQDIKKSAITDFSSENLEEASQFLQLNALDRLQLVLGYLRDKYAYCFWCGTQYQDESEMEQTCPGANEDDHD